MVRLQDFLIVRDSSKDEGLLKDVYGTGRVSSCNASA